MSYCLNLFAMLSGIFSPALRSRLWHPVAGPFIAQAETDCQRARLPGTTERGLKGSSRISPHAAAAAAVRTAPLGNGAGPPAQRY